MLAADGQQLNIFEHIWIEYDRLEPVCLCEFKCGATARDANQIAVLVNLARRADLPALLVRYWPAPIWLQEWHFYVEARNKQAEHHVGPAGLEMGEPDFVGLLYRMRDRQVPAEVAAWLATLADPYDPGRPF